MALESGPGRSTLVLTRVAAFVAIGLVTGLLLSSVPNVELVTAVCFVSGFLLGFRAGLLTGALTEALFAGFHPMGSSIGLLLVAQILGMMIAGAAGAVAARITGSTRRGLRYGGVIVLTGAAATVLFDLLTNLAYPLMAGFSFFQTGVVLLAAVPFAAIHLGANTLVFLFIVRPLIPRLERVWFTS